MPLGTKVGHGPGHIVIVLHWSQPRPPKKGAQPPPNFRPMSIVGNLSPISATAEQLLISAVYQPLMILTKISRN